MRLTLGEKYSCVIIGPRWMAIILMLLATLNAFPCAMVDGWQFDMEPSVELSEGDSCRLRSGESGICRKIESCTAIINALDKKQIKYDSLVRCTFAGLSEVICCPSGNTGTKTPPTVRATTQSVIPRTQSERPAEAACRTYRELDPAALTFHILDGIPVAPGDYPHMGGLIYPGSGSANQVDLRCGSSLISERYVLTAAHCVNDPLLQPITVRFGVVIWNVTDEDNPPIDVDIESIILHPNYIAPARYHDIALIRLARNVEFSFAVRPACLYSNTADVDSSTKLVVIGWGITNIQTRARSDILLMTNVTTVPLNECNTTHVGLGVQRTLRNGLNLGQYCAYDPELQKDSCEADSGGPLQIVENKHSTIVGVVSFGMSCGSAVPSVYARVAFYLSWIESVVWPS